jgi:eukaryotic-like serine/threonine-protein kinase
LVGSVVGERYRITKLLGLGGMGAVYLAEHILMQKTVAIKVLHREMTALPEVVERFEREAVAAARIDHPNVVQARDFGQVDGAFYLVLDYVEGEPLAELLERELFPVERALNVAGQIAEALEAAHGQGIIHRDLKPDNVMLVARPGQPELVKVLDFGIAKISFRERGESERPITRIGAVFGTPEYMSPEQAAGQRVDERSDLYSLGTLLYRMLSGRTPFIGDEINAVLMMQITQTPPPLPDSVPREVSRLVFELLEKDPERRIQTAGAVVQRVLDVLGSGATSSQGRTRSRLSSYTGQRQSWVERLDASPAGARWVVGRGSLPAWRLVAGAAATMLFGATLVFAWFRPASPDAEAVPPVEPGVSAVPALVTSVRPVPSAADPELEKVVGLAFGGDEDAVNLLAARPASTRGVREWLALGTGSAKLNRARAAVEAYRSALELESALAADPVLLKDVYEATRDEAAAELAVRTAAEYLGKRGADLLYRIWVDTREVTAVTRLAKELVYTKAVRDVASPALGFVLRWREAVNCDQYQALLPDAVVNADMRAFLLLQRAARTNDCQLPAEALQAALVAAKQRPEPVPF